MTWDGETIRRFGWDIQRLIGGADLGRERSYEMFKEVLLDAQPELQQGAFLAALVAKGETPEEIAGAWQAIDEIDTVHTTASFPDPVVENSGTGMDQARTFNVSSAAAIVAAANGIRMGRHAARGLTSPCGAVDILEAVGVDVECDVAVVERSIQETGIGLFNGMSPKVHPKALARILGRIRFGSTLNVAASLASPCRPRHGVRGVYSPDLLPTVSDVMREIGYQRGMIVHGLGGEGRRGMDELSVLGESLIHEFFPNGRHQESKVAPEDFGLSRARYEEVVQTGDIQRESMRFVQVLAGKGSPVCVDFTCLNAAAILYLMGKAKDIKHGLEMCYGTVANGRAVRKLAEWVHVQNSGNGPARLEAVLKAAQISL